jgi:hypothetical protein
MSGAGRYSCIFVRQFAHDQIMRSNGRARRVPYNCDGLNTCAGLSAEEGSFAYGIETVHTSVWLLKFTR